MAKLWSTEDILGWDEGDLLVWHHRLNHRSLKYLLRLSKRGIITRKLSKVRPPPCVTCLFGEPHKRPRRTKGKRSDRSISETLENRTREMTSIDQMVSDQPGLIPQVTGDLTHTRLWEATVIVYHYSKY